MNQILVEVQYIPAIWGSNAEHIGPRYLGIAKVLRLRHAIDEDEQWGLQFRVENPVRVHNPNGEAQRLLSTEFKTRPDDKADKKQGTSSDMTSPCHRPSVIFTCFVQAQWPDHSCWCSLSMVDGLYYHVMFLVWFLHDPMPKNCHFCQITSTWSLGFQCKQQQQSWTSKQQHVMVGFQYQSGCKHWSSHGSFLARASHIYYTPNLWSTSYTEVVWACYK